MCMLSIYKMISLLYFHWISRQNMDGQSGNNPISQMGDKKFQEIRWLALDNTANNWKRQAEYKPCFLVSQVSVYFGRSEVLDFKINALDVLLRQASVKYEHVSAKLFLSFTACFISFFRIIPLEGFVLLACCVSLMIQSICESGSKLWVMITLLWVSY